MVSFRALRLGIAISLLHLIPIGRSYSAEPVESSAVGNLMTTLFSPVIAAETKTMAVLQRTSLLDRIARNRNLEIALLIDGTDSMSDELDGVRRQLDRMVDDLQRLLDDRVAFQIVVYRDAAAPSGIVEFAMPANGKGFATDRKQIADGLKRLVVETGAPYFLEPVDVGLHKTLSELPWTTNDDAVRWILLVGDAPPFEDGFSEPENRAERKYSDQQLLQLAQQKGINIHTILCRSRPTEQEAYEEVLSRTQQFFTAISEGTGGAAIDLSSETDRANLQEAAKRAAVEYIVIEPISEADIENAQIAATKVSAANNALSPRPIQIAVLPFIAQEESAIAKGNNPFDGAKNPANFLVDRIVSLLDSMGAQGVRKRDIERAFREVQKEGIGKSRIAKRIGELVDADYVLAASQTKINNGSTRYDFELLSTDKGEVIVKPGSKLLASATTDASAAYRIVEEISRVTATAPNVAANTIELRKLLAKVARQNPKLRQVNLSDVKVVEEAIIRAQSALDGIVEFELQDDDSADVGIRKALQLADTELREALKQEPDNPIALMVLANIRMSEILLDPTSPDARAKREQANRSLQRAKIQAGTLTPTALAELEADIALLDGQYDKAIEKYKLLEELQGSLSATLRARWMLMGLYLGDWGVSEASSNLVSLPAARSAAIRILAFHPDSKHALRLRSTLRISPNNPLSASPAIPMKNPHGFQ